jgi:hypothetical protein
MEKTPVAALSKPLEAAKASAPASEKPPGAEPTSLRSLLLSGFPVLNTLHSWIGASNRPEAGVAPKPSNEKPAVLQ